MEENTTGKAKISTQKKQSYTWLPAIMGFLDGGLDRYTKYKHALIPLKEKEIRNDLILNIILIIFFFSLGFFEVLDGSSLGPIIGVYIGYLFGKSRRKIEKTIAFSSDK